MKLKWDEIKRQEKNEKGAAAGAPSVLDEVLPSLPALMEALKLSNKAAAARFEWPNVGGVLEKLQEEAGELAEARHAGDQAHVEHELGDMFFTLVNFARFLNADPEQCLRRANSRFRQRFGLVQRALEAKGSSPETASLAEMESLWQEVKRQLALAEGS